MCVRGLYHKDSKDNKNTAQYMHQILRLFVDLVGQCCRAARGNEAKALPRLFCYLEVLAYLFHFWCVGAFSSHQKTCHQSIQSVLAAKNVNEPPQCFRGSARKAGFMSLLAMGARPCLFGLYARRT